MKCGWLFVGGGKDERAEAKKSWLRGHGVGSWCCWLRAGVYTRAQEKTTRLGGREEGD